MSGLSTQKVLLIERRNQRWWLLDGLDFRAIAESIESATSVLESVQRNEPTALVAIRGPVTQG